MALFPTAIIDRPLMALFFCYQAAHLSPRLTKWGIFRETLLAIGDAIPMCFTFVGWSKTFDAWKSWVRNCSSVMQAKVGPLSFFNNVFHVCMEGGGAQEARLLIVKVRRSYKVEVNLSAHCCYHA